MHLLKIILFFFLVFITSIIYGQEGYTPDSISCPTCRVESPTPPPAAGATDYSNISSYYNNLSLGSFGEAPVDVYSGLAEISVPIYTIQTTDYSVPLSLNYNSTGVKVEEVAGWVGLGWNIGGIAPVTRMIRGGDDFITSAGTDNPSNYLSSGNSSCFICGSSVCIPKETDLQLDIFSFQAGTYSGKFFLDWSRATNRQVHIISKEKIDIQLIYTTNVQIPGIQITTPDGVKYLYGEVPGGTYSSTTYLNYVKYTEEAITTTVQTNANNTTQTINNTNVVAWYLRSVTTPLQNQITFDYYPVSKYYPIYTNKQSQEYIYSTSTDLSTATANKHTSVSQTVTILGGVLSTINFPNGSITCAISSRLDVATTATFYKLDNIQIYSNGIKTKKVGFSYDYFNSTISTSNPELYKRLKLTTLSEYDVNSDLPNSPYTFTYNESSISFGTVGSTTLRLPPRNSLGADHWGYCNNKNAGQTVWLPTQELVTNPNDNSLINFTQGLNRDIDPAYSQAGVLTRITYPTKGYTDYIYEPNSYFSSLSTPKRDKQVGGLRIKQTRSSDGVTGNDSYKVYVYKLTESNGDPNVYSSGVLQQDIQYTRMPKSSNQYFGYPVVRSYNNVLPLGPHNNGNIVGYTEVTVLEGLNGEYGKTNYKFHSFPYYSADVFDPSTSPVIDYYNRVYTILTGITPSFTSQTAEDRKYQYVRNGLPKEQSFYKKQGASFVLKNKKTFEYNSQSDNSIMFPMPSGYQTNVSVILSGELGIDPNTGLYVCNYFFFIVYNDISALKIKLTKQTEYTYSEVSSSNYITNTTDYEYTNDAHYLVTKITKNINDADAISTEFYYPVDFGVSAGNPEFPFMSPYTKLSTNNQHNIVVEKVVKKKIAGTYKVVDGSFVKYQTIGSLNLPQAYYSLATNQPLTESPTYTTTAGYFSNTINSNLSQSTFRIDDNYTIKPIATADVYDTHGNLLSSSLNGVNKSTVWGYSQTLPIARVNNANNTQIAFTSIESNALGGWALGSGTYHKLNSADDNVHSGDYSYKLVAGSLVWGPSINIKPMPQTSGNAGKYKFSCWIKTEASYGTTTNPQLGEVRVYTVNEANDCCTDYPNVAASSVKVPITDTQGKWVYYETPVLDLDLSRSTGSVPSGTYLSLRAYVGNYNGKYVLVDDLRVLPIDAEMESSTFYSNLGQTSITDKNNVITHIEYDGLFRPLYIKDQDKNVIKKFTYIYRPY